MKTVIGCKDVSIGCKDVSIGCKDVSIGCKDVSMSPQDVQGRQTSLLCLYSVILFSCFTKYNRIQSKH